MPGPSEPKRMSPFLDLLVDELLQLWRGVSISIASVRSFNIRAALLCLFLILCASVCVSVSQRT